MNRREFLRKACKMFGWSTLFWMTGCGCRAIVSEDDLLTTATPDNDNSTNSNTIGKEASFYRKLEDKFVECNICFRNCTISQGRRGFCRNRENYNGRLYNIVYSRPSAIHLDPIEKEPMYHYLPGTNILCIGTAGCNFRCKYCHNWHLSQQSVDDIRTIGRTPEEIVNMAKVQHAPTISFTYNEPTTFYEYMYDIARLAQKEGIGVIFHSNGSMNQKPLKELLKYVNAVTVDLKAYCDTFYHDISGAKLEPVLQTLKTIKESGTWLEIVNLVVTDLNDSIEKIHELCIWMRDNLGVDTPLHFTRFFPSYQMTDSSPTPITRLDRALEIAQEVGIRFISIGNVPGHHFNSTFCPQCKRVLIQRHHFTVIKNLIQDGKCYNCGEKIPGVWEQI